MIRHCQLPMARFTCSAFDTECSCRFPQHVAVHHGCSQVLNEEKCLGATLDALRIAVEGGRQLEVIVVDGGSTDKCVCVWGGGERE